MNNLNTDLLNEELFNETFTKIVSKLKCNTSNREYTIKDTSIPNISSKNSNWYKYLLNLMNDINYNSDKLLSTVCDLVVIFQTLYNEHETFIKRQNKLEKGKNLTEENENENNKIAKNVNEKNGNDDHDNDDNNEYDNLNDNKNGVLSNQKIQEPMTRTELVTCVLENLLDDHMLFRKSILTAITLFVVPIYRTGSSVEILLLKYLLVKIHHNEYMTINDFIEQSRVCYREKNTKEMIEYLKLKYPSHDIFKSVNEISYKIFKLCKKEKKYINITTRLLTSPDIKPDKKHNEKNSLILFVEDLLQKQPNDDNVLLDIYIFSQLSENGRIHTDVLDDGLNEYRVGFVNNCIFDLYTTTNLDINLIQLNWKERLEIIKSTFANIPTITLNKISKISELYELQKQSTLVLSYKNIMKSFKKITNKSSKNDDDKNKINKNGSANEHCNNTNVIGDDNNNDDDNDNNDDDDDGDDNDDSENKRGDETNNSSIIRNTCKTEKKGINKRSIKVDDYSNVNKNKKLKL